MARKQGWWRRWLEVSKPRDELSEELDKMEAEMRERAELEVAHRYHNPSVAWYVPPSEPCSLCALESLEE